MLQVTNVSEFRKNLKKYIDGVAGTHHKVIVNSNGKSVVMMSLDEFNGMDETDYLFHKFYSEKPWTSSSGRRLFITLLDLNLEKQVFFTFSPLFHLVLSLVMAARSGFKFFTNSSCCGCLDRCNSSSLRPSMDEETLTTPNPKCRLFYKIDLLINGLCGIVFNRFYRLVIHLPVVGIFDPACELLPPWTKQLYLCTVAPIPSLWPNPPPFPN